VTPRIGLGLTGENLPIDDIIDLGVRADRAGFDSVWHSENQRDPWVPLSVMASRTERIRIGTGIALWARSPVVTELAAANLDELSCGRFVLGLGTGPKSRNEAWYGVPYHAPVERMQEYIELLRLMWSAHSGNTIDYAGSHFPVRRYRRALRPYRERIPVFIGAMRRRMVELAGELADGLLLDSVTTAPYLERRAIPALEAGLARAGRSRRDVEVGSMLITAVHPDLGQARAWARGQVAYYMAGSHADPIIRLHGFEQQAARLRTAAAEGDSASMIEAVDDDMLDAIAVVGPVDRCRAQIAKSRDLDLAVLVAPAFHLSSAEIRANALGIVDAFGE